MFVRAPVVNRCPPWAPLFDLQEDLSARPPRAASLLCSSRVGEWIPAINQAFHPPLRHQRRDLCQVIAPCADEHQMCAGLATKRGNAKSTCYQRSKCRTHAGYRRDVATTARQHRSDYAEGVTAHCIKHNILLTYYLRKVNCLVVGDRISSEAPCQVGIGCAADCRNMCASSPCKLHGVASDAPRSATYCHSGTLTDAPNIHECLPRSKPGTRDGCCIHMRN